MQKFTIEKNDSGQRLDKYLFKLLKEAPQSLIYKQLRNKNITLNEHKANGKEITQTGDAVFVFMADETIAKFRGDRSLSSYDKVDFSDFKVVYEDEDILIADKPVGVLSQKAETKDISMNEKLLAYLEDKGYRPGNSFTPAFCNRLDRNTDGLMLAGISLKGTQELSGVLKDRSLRKYYLAIVKGRLDQPSFIRGYLYKDESTNRVTIYQNRPEDVETDAIETEYMPVSYREDRDISLVRVHLITGKTHQIRAHLSFIGHPILGDPKYGDRSFNQALRERVQFLHAYEVIFPENMTELPKLSGRYFRTSYPKRFMAYFDRTEAESEWQNPEA